MAKYKEVVRPPISLFAFLLFMYFTFALAIWAAFDTFTASIVFLLLIITIPFIWQSATMKISVDDELRIDRAHIDLKFVKGVEVLDRSAFKRLRGVDTDARAFFISRPWLSTGIKVRINDSEDPTPYWLIGCKRPRELLSALSAD